MYRKNAHLQTHTKKYNTYIVSYLSLTILRMALFALNKNIHIITRKYIHLNSKILCDIIIYKNIIQVQCIYSKFELKKKKKRKSIITSC